MKIIGEYDNDFFENYHVSLKIKKGILAVYKTNKSDNINKPLNDKDWNFRKINWKENKPVVPINSDIKNIKTKPKFSHVLEYRLDDNNTQRIFINPTQWQSYNIKKNQGKLFWQRITLYESILAGLIVLFLQVIGNFIYQEIIKSVKKETSIVPKKTVKQNTQNCQQDSTTKILTTPSLIDSLN